MRIAAIAIFSALVLLSGIPGARAAAGVCGSPQEAAITITPVYDEVAYEFYQPMLRIKAMADTDDPSHHSEQWPVGLSTGELFVKLSSEIQTRRSLHDSIVCGSLKSIDVQVGFTNNKVYVAREFPRRSCPHRTVLAHEELHKAVDRKLLAEYTEKARYFFDDLAKRLGVVANPSAKALEAELNFRVNEELRQFTNSMGAERAKRQAAVDTHEEYERVSASCNGQTMDVVNQRVELLRESDPSFAVRIKPMPAPAATLPGN